MVFWRADILDGDSHVTEDVADRLTAVKWRKTAGTVIDRSARCGDR
jgi:hypothetical protein